MIDNDEFNLVGVTAGDTVLVHSAHRQKRADQRGEPYGPEECEVAKVGRTLVHVTVGDYGRTNAFYIANGKEQWGTNQVGMPDQRAFTRPGWDLYVRRIAVLGRLRDLTRYSWQDALPVAALELVADTIEKPVQVIQERGGVPTICTDPDCPQAKGWPGHDVSLHEWARGNKK